VQGPLRHLVRSRHKDLETAGEWRLENETEERWAREKIVSIKKDDSAT